MIQKTEKLSTCNCAEVFLEQEHTRQGADGKTEKYKTKKRLPFSEHHNCEYIRKRNGLIPSASSYAVDVMMKTKVSEPEEKSRIFNKAFGKKMEELSKNLINS